MVDQIGLSFSGLVQLRRSLCTKRATPRTMGVFRSGWTTVVPARATGFAAAPRRRRLGVLHLPPTVELVA